MYIIIEAERGNPLNKHLLIMKNSKTYKIESGDVEMGEYEGADEQEALENYAKDAGYKSYEDLVSQHGEVDSIEEA